jgi:hypothetical protein
MAHNHPKPPTPYKPKPKPSNPNMPVTWGELNEWADYVYHWMIETKAALDIHMHAVEDHMASRVPPAHSSRKGAEPTDAEPSPGPRTHITDPPEPPWEM